MPTTILNPSGPGPFDEWEVIGDLPGWEATQKGSGDVFRIRTQTVTNRSYYYAGTGYMPYWGAVSAVTVHYRARQTVAGAGGAIHVSIIRNGIEELVSGPHFFTNTDWVDGETRVRSDWLTVFRFGPDGIGELGIGPIVFVAPSSGYVEVSEMWLEVEYLNTDWYYDPFDMALPDAIVGEEDWSTAGAQLAFLTLDDYLEILDLSAVDYRVYYRQNLDWPDQYLTDLETRLICYQKPATDGFF
jgi:hypothetical protein